MFSPAPVEWLLDRAVVHPTVQEMINKRITRSFPTFFVLADFVCYVFVLVTYSISIWDTILRLVQQFEKGLVPQITPQLHPLYVGVVWFILREIVQMISLIVLGHFRDGWVKDANNWIDMTYILVIVINIVILETKPMLMTAYQFRTLATLSLMVLWINIMVCHQCFIFLSGFLLLDAGCLLLLTQMTLYSFNFLTNPLKNFLKVGCARS